MVEDIEFEQDELKSKMTINANGCWIWNGLTDRHGYSRADGYRISSLLHERKVHRISYILFKGTIPPGLLVRHKCRFRSCCNPNHLELGTHQDNMDDKSEIVQE